ncbi:MAG: hypothetical protein KIT45_15285 [Fimbriimonadia bacterium]|nr:hypothetical protein [Fimbriimonadia bacterium]
MLERPQKWMGVFLVMGGVLIVLGLIATLILCGGGATSFIGTGDSTTIQLAWIGPVIVLIGSAMILGSIFYGAWLSKRIYSGPSTRIENVYVIAKFAVNDQGETVPFYNDYPEELLQWYVRLELPNRRKEEFRCAREVFNQIGEGLRGDAVCQGLWLNSFQPRHEV